MSVSDWIAVAGVLLGGGGGAQLVAKLTRLAVAVETLVESNKKMVAQVNNHEKRLNRGGL